MRPELPRLCQRHPAGTHDIRHGGSIGTNMTPGRTFLNLKMPGQYGNDVRRC
jgi:ribosomal protein L3